MSAYSSVEVAMVKWVHVIVVDLLLFPTCGFSALSLLDLPNTSLSD